MTIRSFFRQDAFASEMYVIVCGTEAVVLDPSAPVSMVQNAFGGELPTVRYILLTHAHFDHFLELSDWQEQTGATVLVGAKDLAKLNDATLNGFLLFLGRDIGYHGNAVPVGEGEWFRVGDSSFSVIETPGHTDGSVTYLFDKTAFVGDLVFRDGALGRTDLPGADAAAILPSLEKVLSLSPETVIYPGHGEPTSVLQLREIYSES